MLEVVLHDIDSHQGLISLQQFGQAHPVLLFLHVLRVPQQQPAGPLDQLSGRLVCPQAVGLIDPYPVDDLAAVLGDDMKQIINDGRLWSLLVFIILQSI